MQAHGEPDWGPGELRSLTGPLQAASPPRDRGAPG